MSDRSRGTMRRRLDDERPTCSREARVESFGGSHHPPTLRSGTLANMSVVALASLLAKPLTTSIARRLPTYVLGSRFEREIEAAMAVALEGATRQLGRSESERDFLLVVLSDNIEESPSEVAHTRWEPSRGSLTALIRESIYRQMQPMDDLELTGVGVSAFNAMDVNTQEITSLIHRGFIDEIIRNSLDPVSTLQSVARVLSDERLHNSLISTVDGLRSLINPPTAPSNEELTDAAVSLVDRELIVPDGEDSVVLRCAVTNLASEPVRLRHLIFTVAEVAPSATIRLRQAGAQLKEIDLDVDLRAVITNDALHNVKEQFILARNESEAFRVNVTVEEGRVYRVVVHADTESIISHRRGSGQSDVATIDFPVQSVAALRETGLL